MVDSLVFNTILNRMAADLKKDELVIPSMPELVATLSKQINNPNITVKDLANIIGSDTSVSSQLIRLSQTLRYSNPGTTITSLPNAISRIGLNSSTSISLALAIEQTFEFKDEKLQAFCKTKVLYANILCRLALTMRKLKYSFVTPVAADFVILSSALLNIGVLPFIGALDNYIRDSEKEFDINTKIINDHIKKIKDTLAIAILRHWKFDKAFEDGIIDRVLTTNCIHQTPELLERPWYINCDLSKYIALIIDTLNHDSSISSLLNPYERINNILERYKNGEDISK